MNAPVEQAKAPSAFRAELETLINRHSMENGSDTPDFVLADYLQDCLTAFDRAVRARDRMSVSVDDRALDRIVELAEHRA